ncbi:hypothetical protein NUK34_08035 [Kerstersia gyiorum]|uniref:hypothetical protein n=1 Tax=Kerstersia gyiorum TaxID=206506 RepID=UPI00214F7CB0|nr:hypothetical protein [Kerstersia gyiorum]MCR4158800.1 hypothetical protein [Kerstersia gyiorum]
MIRPLYAAYLVASTAFVVMMFLASLNVQEGSLCKAINTGNTQAELIESGITLSAAKGCVP